MPSFYHYWRRFSSDRYLLRLCWDQLRFAVRFLFIIIQPQILAYLYKSEKLQIQMKWFLTLGNRQKPSNPAILLVPYGLVSIISRDCRKGWESKRTQNSSASTAICVTWMLDNLSLNRLILPGPLPPTTDHSTDFDPFLVARTILLHGTVHVLSMLGK